MTKIWCYKSPSTLTNSEKDEIIEKVFNTIIDNDMCEDIGEEVVDYATSKGYVFQEDIED